MKITISPNIQLQQMNLEHIEEFFASIHQNCSTTDDYRLRLQRKYNTIEALDKRITHAIEQKLLIDGTPDFLIFYQDQLAGMFEFHPITKPDQIEIGYWLYEEFRGKGVLSQILPRMIAYAQTHFEISTIRATTAVGNIPSQKLLEKCGFIWTNALEYQVEGKPKREFEYFYYL